MPFRRTALRAKTVGLKQGCPLSPRLFTLVLDHILRQTLVRFHPHNPLTDVNLLPLCLAYADDLLYLATEEADIEEFCDSLMPLFHKAGLSINKSKSEVLV